MTPTPDPIAAIERTDEFVERVAIQVHSKDSDEHTLKWSKQPGKYRASIRRDVRDVIAALGECGFEVYQRSVILTAARQAAEKDAEIARLRRLATDRKYMLEAYRNMLGPKGLEVVTMWERQGVTRQHTTWGPEAHFLSGEDRAQVLLDVQTAVSVPMDFIDGGLPRVDVRSLTTEISDAQG